MTCKNCPRGPYKDTRVFENENGVHIWFEVCGGGNIIYALLNVNSVNGQKTVVSRRYIKTAVHICRLTRESDDKNPVKKKHLSVALICFKCEQAFASNVNGRSVSGPPKRGHGRTVTSIIYHLSSIIYHLSSIIYHLPFIIYHLSSSIIYHLSSIIYHLSSIIYHLSSFIYHLSSIIYHLSPIIYHLSSIIYHQSSSIILIIPVVVCIRCDTAKLEA
jgi:hypothetical protein